MTPELARSFISQENQMINNRMNWFLVLQGLVLASLAFAWKAPGDEVIIAFTTVGTFSSLSIGILLRCSIRAIENVQNKCTDKSAPLIALEREDISKVEHIMLPWNFLPVLFIAVWIAIAMIRLFCVPANGWGTTA